MQRLRLYQAVLFAHSKIVSTTNLPRQRGKRSWSWNLIQAHKTPTEMYSYPQGTQEHDPVSQPSGSYKHVCAQLHQHKLKMRKTSTISSRLMKQWHHHSQSKKKRKKKKVGSDVAHLRGRCFWVKQTVWTMTTKECLGYLPTEAACEKTQRPKQTRKNGEASHLSAKRQEPEKLEVNGSNLYFFLPESNTKHRICV